MSTLYQRLAPAALLFIAVGVSGAGIDLEEHAMPQAKPASSATTATDNFQQWLKAQMSYPRVRYISAEEVQIAIGVVTFREGEVPDAARFIAANYIDQVPAANRVKVSIFVNNLKVAESALERAQAKQCYRKDFTRVVLPDSCGLPAYAPLAKTVSPLKKHYGDHGCYEAIMDGTMILKSSKADVLDLCGSPTRKNESKGSYGSREQWIYANHYYVYLDDGIVSSVSNTLR